jgi:hypothetical protein
MLDLEEQIKNKKSVFFHSPPIISPCWRVFSYISTHLYSYPQKMVCSLVKICRVVLEKKLTMWKVYRQTDRWTDEEQCAISKAHLSWADLSVMLKLFEGHVIVPVLSKNTVYSFKRSLLEHALIFPDQPARLFFTVHVHPYKGPLCIFSFTTWYWCTIKALNVG